MTNYNEGLDEILDNVLIGMYCTNPDGDFVPLYDSKNVLRDNAKQAIEAHTKAEIAKVLDRLEQAIKDGGYEASYELCCVQAERNKLKESK